MEKPTFKDGFYMTMRLFWGGITALKAPADWGVGVGVLVVLIGLGAIGFGQLYVVEFLKLDLG